MTCALPGHPRSKTTSTRTLSIPRTTLSHAGRPYSIDITMLKTSMITHNAIPGEMGRKVDKLYGKEALLEFNPGKVLFPQSFLRISNDINDIPMQDDDVLLCSYPRTGSTWAQEMVWLVGHDLDFERAKSVQQVRCPLLELSGILLEDQEVWHRETVKTSSIDLIGSMPRPRYIRSHLPWDLLPKGLTREDGSIRGKVIYTIRNPKDICVSYFHYNKLTFDFKGDFNDFCELFFEGRVPLGPLWNHVLGFYARRHDPNLLILKYEDMKKDFPKEIKRTAEFLNKTLTDEQVEKICDYLSFDNMKNNKAVNLEPIIEKIRGEQFVKDLTNKFIRNGKIGDWRNHMTEEMSDRFDEWIKENCKGTDLCFE